MAQWVVGCAVMQGMHTPQFADELGGGFISRQPTTPLRHDLRDSLKQKRTRNAFDGAIRMSVRCSVVQCGASSVLRSEEDGWRT